MEASVLVGMGLRMLVLADSKVVAVEASVVAHKGSCMMDQECNIVDQVEGKGTGKEMVRLKQNEKDLEIKIF